MATLLGGCFAEPLSFSGVRSELSATERRARAEIIRDEAARRGLNNGLLLAGIASAETGLAHCWSEATWACQGPDSVDCGGPVIAGSADGPCADEQGGLGMFQFDAGTYAETLAREGESILTVAGNVAAAVTFVVRMVKRSRYIDGVDTDEEALAWMNEVRPWNDLFHPWIQTVTHYYNGCVPGSCSVYESRYEGYSENCENMLEELGSMFWYGDSSDCGPIPSSGGILEESDACFVAGGPSAFWRSVDEGHGGGLLWTNATDRDESANYAVWKLRFTEAGEYRIEAHTDARWAESRQAGYLVTHADGTETVVLDQTAADGFQDLGVFRFSAEDGQQIRLNDNTGEPNSGETAIVADALRITPVGGITPTPDAGVEPGMDGGPGVPPLDSPRANVSRLPDSGCSVVGPESQSSAGLWLGGFALALLIRRRSARR